MGLLDFFKRRTKNVSDTSYLRTQNNLTVIGRPDFTLQLPFEWEGGDVDNGYEFQNKTLPEQLFVTVHPFVRKMAPAEIEEGINRLELIRRESTKDVGSDKLHFDPVATKRGDNWVELRVTGHDPGKEVRFAYAIRGTPSKSVTVAIFRYLLKEVGAPFVDYSGIIFDLFEIK